MLRTLLVLALVALVGIALAPRVVPVLTWVLAFLSLLMLGDLVLSGVRKYRDRSR